MKVNSTLNKWLLTIVAIAVGVATSGSSISVQAQESGAAARNGRLQRGSLEQLPVLLPQSLVFSGKLKPSTDFSQERVELADISPSPANGLADVTGLMAFDEAE